MLYIIIDSNIIDDKDLLSSEKLLYGLIYTLCQTELKCWASNSYFQKKLNCDYRTVTRYISHLKEKGYIYTKYEKKDGKTKRIIYINRTILSTNIGHRCPWSIDTDVLHNNIDNIKDNINNKELYDFDWLNESEE